MKPKPNRYERHTNLRALEKKSRAKFRHIENQDRPTSIEESWAKLTITEPGTLKVGFLSEAQRAKYIVIDNEGVWQARLSVAITAEMGANLVIGDRILFRPPDQNGKTTIEGRLPRHTMLARLRGDRQRISVAGQEEQLIAANVDVAVIVAAKTQPEFHPRFVDRYIIICQNGNVQPMVCLNKSDLPGETHAAIEIYRSAGIPVLETSIRTGQGIEELKGLLKNKMAAFVGSSGVGKSSLIGSITGKRLEAKEVSAKTGKGRHTTTSSSLYRWAPDSYLVDTPGIRALGIFHIDKKSLQWGFPEFLRYIGRCQYRDCTHSHEPGCAIKDAVARGDIHASRYESYGRMLEE